MNRINEYGIEPGTYEHHEGRIYVVTDVITHAGVSDVSTMETLSDPLVVYRDVETPVRTVNGRATAVHQVYAMSISNFNQRFKKL